MKTEVLKAGAAMDDSTETKLKLEKLDDMPAVDMSMTHGEASVGENLEVDDDDEEANALDAENRAKEQHAMDVDEEEADPLDAFMSDVKQEVQKVNEDDLKRGILPVTRKEDRMDNDNEEGDEIVPAGDELDAIDNADDILALAAKKIRKKDLAAVDHQKVKYESFRKEFYHPPPDIADMTDEEADLLRLALDGIKVRGKDFPRPITKWSHCGLPATSYVVCFTFKPHSCLIYMFSLDVIKRLGFTAPTPIQSQAIPSIMSGRDVIGVAKTGSGKTVAFLLPLFRHIKDQRPLEQMEGPMAIVMTPTRELAVQIHRDCKPFLKVLNLRVRSGRRRSMYFKQTSFSP